MLLLIVKGSSNAAIAAVNVHQIPFIDITYMPRFNECHIWVGGDYKSQIMEWFGEAQEPPLGQVYAPGTLLFFTERTDR